LSFASKDKKEAMIFENWIERENQKVLMRASQGARSRTALKAML
jgi:hypothetical protein